MKHKIFNKTHLATSLSLILGVSILPPVTAAEKTAKNDIEVVEVKGIRGSLVKAMDVKRDSAGVVDSINAEDMGKFPDTNLAESLQRITGVSIDRSNGEGSRVTVRGFGPEFNLVTLNGRQMPTASIQATSASGSRSFDFGNIASEGISAVEVYKTGRAANPVGGIGATINIITARPLNSPGLKTSVQVKGVMDQSTEKGSSITPELSAIYSNTFADDTFGISLTGSYQDRESGYNDAQVASGWRSFTGNSEGWGNLPVGDPNELITNKPDENTTYSVPQNLVYGFNEVQRTRTNASLVLQYQPVEALTATLDYNYSQNKVSQQHQDFSVWMGFGHAESSWTDANADGVAGPIIYSENNGGGDLSMGAGNTASVNDNHAIGLNLDYQVNDNLNLAFDMQKSSAESQPDSPYGNSATLSTASWQRAKTTVDFSQDFPVLTIGYDEGEDGLDSDNMRSTGSSFRNSYMKSEIDQLQLSGEYVFDDGIVESINFGIGRTEVNNRSAFRNIQRDSWGGVGSADDFSDSTWITETLADKFDNISGSDNPNLQPIYFSWDFDSVASQVAAQHGIEGDEFWPCGTSFCASDDYNTDRRVEEISNSAYIQASMSFDIANMPVNVVAGVRYEETDINSSALVPVITGITWMSANEFRLDQSGEQDFTTLTGAYDHFLPNIDANIEIVDDVFMRASYSETLSRPGYGDIQGGLTLDSVRIQDGLASRGNPALLPFESSNYDLSAEWYYEEGSYIALGGFIKHVDNFIGRDTVQETPFNLAHPAQGEWADAARAAGMVTAPEIKQWIIDNYAPHSAIVINDGDPTATDDQITGQDGQDRLAQFNVSIPVNQEKAKLYGMEFALQHVFGDSGFGGIINYTVVNGDISYDNQSLESQFALLGLSDSANLVAFYDKDGIQARIAYNWRDEFLNSTNDGNGEPNPIYVEAYGQWDANVSYEVNEQFTVFIEAINLTDEITRSHGRHQNNLIGVTQSGSRYNIGMRYKF